MDKDTSAPEIVKPFRPYRILNIFFSLCFVVIISYYLLSAPPVNRSYLNGEDITIHISPNQSLSSIASELEIKNVVRHALVLKSLVILFQASHSVKKGDYLFDKSIPAYKVAWMLARGKHNIDPMKVTFKEGMTNEDMATLLGSKLTKFRRDLFLSNIKSKQGYLFPDTYFFFPETTSDEIVDELSTNFDKQIAPLRKNIENSNHSLSEIITMASIVQKEAQGESDSTIISGILWNRISKGMPLQVDAYRDTYIKAGLPQEPIANPGIIAIKAALYPQSSDYLYYLHGKDGNIHLAKTYEEHKKNISKYLK